MIDSEEDFDWERCTWEGVRRTQLQAYLKLTVRERLEAVELMGQMARALQAMRDKRVAKAEVEAGADPVNPASSQGAG